MVAILVEGSYYNSLLEINQSVDQSVNQSINQSFIYYKHETPRCTRVLLKTCSCVSNANLLTHEINEYVFETFLRLKSLRHLVLNEKR